VNYFGILCFCVCFTSVLFNVCIYGFAVSVIVHLTVDSAR
jgi:hypothetical protein